MAWSWRGGRTAERIDGGAALEEYQFASLEPAQAAPAGVMPGSSPRGTIARVTGSEATTMTADPIEWADTEATFTELLPGEMTAGPVTVPASPEPFEPPEDDGWIQRCRARILALDRNLLPEHATLFARFMSRRLGWRDEAPARPWRPG